MAAEIQYTHLLSAIATMLCGGGGEEALKTAAEAEICLNI